MSNEIASSDAVVIGGELSRGFEETADVVVVGSGAAGMVTATLLAEAGHRVIVLEEGPYYKPEQYGQFRPTETIRRMWREAGLLAAFGVGQTPMIGIAAGRCVGGSSVMTGGVCFRIPAEVHQHWEYDLNLPELSEKALESSYLDVEKRIQVTEVPAEMRSYATRRLVAGAESLGIPMKSARRNIVDCHGNARCNMGCPSLKKMSVDLSYMPKAIAMGTRIISDALVESIELNGKRATGVRGRLLDATTGKPSHRFRIRAKMVVVACGAIHTPSLLMKSGLQGAHVGKNVTVHPSVRLSAQFDEVLDGHNGALQSVYSDHFSDEGLTLVGVHSPPNVLAAALPGIGPSHRAVIRRMRGLAVIGGLVHDKGGGQIRRGPGRESILWYRMDPADLRRVRRLITILGEIAFAAGAKVVYPPVFGISGIYEPQELRRLEHEPLDPRRIECIAFHPLGSARMSKDRALGVVRADGRMHGIDDLYIVDGSILPTSIGVNSQLPVMAMATRIARNLSEKLKSPPAKRSALQSLTDRFKWPSS